MTYKSFSSKERAESLEKLSGIVINNFNVSEKIVRHCAANNIKGYRLSSDLCPVIKHPDVMIGLEDLPNYNLIEEEIREGVKKYIPNLDINSISIMSAEDDPNQERSISQDEDERLFRVSDESTKPYTAVVKIDYTVNNGSFSTSDFIILNI